MNISKDLKKTQKIFKPIKDIYKYILILNNQKGILFECSVFQRKKKSKESNLDIKFLRLYESFMILSSVFIYFIKIKHFIFSANPLLISISQNMTLILQLILNIHFVILRLNRELYKALT